MKKGGRKMGVIGPIYHEIRFIVFCGGFFFMLGYLAGLLSPPELVKQGYNIEAIHQMAIRTNTKTDILWSDLMERLKIKPATVPRQVFPQKQEVPKK
jgi:hypothetical protein